MTDPKTAARTISGRLLERRIRVKHVQALNLVAAGCGFQDRSKLAGLDRLPDIVSVNARLLSSAARLIARHESGQRAIVDVTTEVLTPPAPTIPQDVRSRNEGPYVLAMEDTLANDDIANLFWNDEDGWGAYSSASVFTETNTPLPTLGMTTRQISSMRWMNVDDAAFRAAVDEAIREIDGDEPAPASYPDIEGERPLDYDRIAAIIATKRVFVRPIGPLHIAVLDGAQRAALYVPSLSDDPETAGGQVREWVRDVEEAFRAGLAPDEDRQRGLLMEGDAAISGITHWLEPTDRLWAWLEVAAYPDLIDNRIDADASGVTDGIHLLHGGIDMTITSSELADPESFLASEKAGPIIDAMVADSCFTRWESSRSVLPEDRTQAIVTDFLSHLRSARTDDERRFAKERSLVENLSHADPEDEWYQTGSATWDPIQNAIDEAVEAAGVEGYDSDEWRNAAASAFEKRLVDDDDSTPEGMISSFDKVEIMFWLIPPKGSPDDLCTIAGPWPDPARVGINDEFQFALAKLGWTVTDWRRHVGSKEPSELSGTRPPRGTGQGFPGAVDGSLDPLVSLEDLKVVIENGCTQFFGLVLYAYVPLSDVLNIDLKRHMAFSKAHVALYNPYAGTFMSTVARPGPVVVMDGVDGRFEGLLGESPKDFCGMVMDGFDARLLDHAKDLAARNARTAVKDALPGMGLKLRFPGHSLHWTWEDDARTALVTTIGVDDAERRYSVRKVTVDIDGTEATGIRIEDQPE